MNKAFTLIELMIVIAIIAIIAAIAIPNLLESRITANEAAASSSLKSGVFPAQVQYQSGCYIDVDNDGRGAHSPSISYLAGAVGAGDTLVAAPTKPLMLMDASYNNVLGTARLTIANIAAVLTTAQKGAYDYATFISTTENSAETFWCGIACPHDTTGSEGRRAFAIAANGTVYQNKQTVNQGNTTMTKLSASAAPTTTAPLILRTIVTDATTGAVTTSDELPVTGQATTTDVSSIYQK